MRGACVVSILMAAPVCMSFEGAVLSLPTDNPPPPPASFTRMDSLLGVFLKLISSLIRFSLLLDCFIASLRRELSPMSALPLLALLLRRIDTEPSSSLSILSCWIERAFTRGCPAGGRPYTCVTWGLLVAELRWGWEGARCIPDASLFLLLLLVPVLVVVGVFSNIEGDLILRMCFGEPWMVWRWLLSKLDCLRWISSTLFCCFIARRLLAMSRSNNTSREGGGSEAFLGRESFGGNSFGLRFTCFDSTAVALNALLSCAWPGLVESLVTSLVMSLLGCEGIGIGLPPPPPPSPHPVHPPAPSWVLGAVYIE